MKFPQDPQQLPATPRLSLIAWFAANPVAANLLMLIIFLGGIYSFWHIDKEVIPPIKPELIQITATYPGAGPAEVEKTVCIPIEEAIHDLPGIQRLDTEVNEGRCSVIISLQRGHEMGELLSALRVRTQAIPQLPKAVGKIDIQELLGRLETLAVMLHGPTDRLTLKRLGERIEGDLMAIPGVVRLYNIAQTPYEITIQISADRLRQFHLTLQEVADAMRRSSSGIAGGVIKTPSGELLLRTLGNTQDENAIADVTLRTNPDGTRLRIADVAVIVDGLAEQEYEHRFDGQPTVGWLVFAAHDVMDVAEGVKAYVAAAHLPEGIKLTAWKDSSRSFAQRIDLLVEAGVSGFVLVFLVLLAFLRVRVAFWAGAGILISIFGAIWWMPALGVTFNMLSLFGFLLVMGILVDDAIIIGESIHAHQQRGLIGLAGAIQGVREVAIPVMLAVLIAATAFLPGLFLPGWAGQLMYPLCVVVLLTLLFSLIEALLILPSHLAVTPPSLRAVRGIERLRAACNNGLDVFTRRCYQPLLSATLRWRYLMLAGFMAAMLITSALVASGIIPLSMVADVAVDEFDTQLTLPPGTPFSEVRARVEQVEQALFELREELDRDRPAGQPSVIAHLETKIENHKADFWVELSPQARQYIQIDELVEQWRVKIGDIGPAKINFFYKADAYPYDIELTFSAADTVVLTQAAEALKQRLAAYPGVYDVTDSNVPGKSEVHLTLKPEAERLGLHLKDLAEQVRQAYYGEEAVRLLRGHDEVKVVVRYPAQERESLDALRAMPVRLPGGAEAPLGSLAEARFVSGYANLSRQDRHRVLHIRAQVDEQKVSTQALIADLESGYLQSLEQQFPGLRAGLGWYQEEQDQITQAMVRNTLIALALIYVLLAVPFRSYTQPFIFLLAVPVAWMGAVLAHGIFGLPLSVESLLGIVAASGVVVNDSLVLLDYIHRRRETRVPLHHLIAEACAARFRPIALVFFTNFAGFLPILLETSEQAQFLVPMAVSLAAGLLFGMVATLVFVPVGYAILDDLQRLSARAKPEQPAMDASPVAQDNTADSTHT